MEPSTPQEEEEEEEEEQEEEEEEEVEEEEEEEEMTDRATETRRPGVNLAPSDITSGPCSCHVTRAYVFVQTVQRFQEN